MGSMWDQCGVDGGSIWGRCRVDVGSMWGRCGGGKIKIVKKRLNLPSPSLICTIWERLDCIF